MNYLDPNQAVLFETPDVAGSARRSTTTELEDEQTDQEKAFHFGIKAFKTASINVSYMF